MKFIVVGCGRVGAQLATRLFQQNHQVTVVDIVASAFDNLAPNFRGRTLEGDVLAQDMLRRAGIEGADGLAAVTSSDSLNAVIAHIARTVFHVPNVVTRNYEPRFIPLYEVFGIQTVGASTWGAQRIEELLTDTTLRTVFSAGNGEVEVYEIIVPAAWHGHRLAEIVNHNGCLPIAVTRAGKAMLPSADTLLEDRDILHLSATFEGIEALRRQLVASKEA
jgi:trk/ktr system potassium uptake protein